MLVTFSVVAFNLSAVDVPVNPADFNGSRSTSNASQLTGNSAWGPGGEGFKISWSIVPLGQTFHYIYTITDAAGGPLNKALSHLLLEISPNITQNNIAQIIYNTTPNFTEDSPKTFTPQDGNSNPGMPGNLYGLKFEDFANSSLPVIDFISTRIPIWGDFYAKDGKTGGQFNYVFNTNFGTDPTLATVDFSGWIPIPDTHVINVPEPETWLILGSVLAISCLAGMRKRMLKTAR
jgi:hypothetical protein